MKIGITSDLIASVVSGRESGMIQASGTGLDVAVVDPLVLANIATLEMDDVIVDWEGSGHKMMVYGTLPDGRKLDVTAFCTFVSSAPLVATVVGGVVFPQSVGNTNITASLSPVIDVTKTASVRPMVTSISVAPHFMTKPAGSITQLVVTGISQHTGLPNNITGLCTFLSMDPAVALVNAVGEVNVIADGYASIEVEYMGHKGYMGLAGITPVAGQMHMYPSAFTLSLATNPVLGALIVAFNVEGNVQWLDGASVAWTTANAAVADVDAQGMIEAKGIGGPINITGTYNGVALTCAITVVA